MKLRVYLDTSVFSAYYDDRVTDRQVETEEFWTRLSEFEVSTSELTREELAQTPDVAQRAKLEELLKDFTMHPITDEMKTLARNYIDRGVFSPVVFNDALHVAAAVLTRQDVLLSWNFKHLVNRRRRAMVNEVNIFLGLPTIEIVAPPEV
jgi:predicted nucleic acid-binding protein